MNTTCVRVGSVIAVCMAAVLAACGTVGEKEFACPGRPPGVRCMSATEVYRATQTSDFVEPTSRSALGDESKTAPRAKHRPLKSKPLRQSKAPLPSAGQGDATVQVRTDVLTPAVERPVPIRTPAKVMRAWIAPWEDSRGVLHSGGYAFIEIESRRWSFGEMETAEPVRFFSIQRPTAETKETVGKDQGASNARTGTSERSKRPNSSTLPKTGASK